MPALLFLHRPYLPLTKYCPVPGRNEVFDLFPQLFDTRVLWRCADYAPNTTVHPRITYPQENYELRNTSARSNYHGMHFHPPTALPRTGARVLPLGRLRIGVLRSIPVTYRADFNRRRVHGVVHDGAEFCGWVPAQDSGLPKIYVDLRALGPALEQRTQERLSAVTHVLDS
ncbi:hypothetical protein B0H10DRAFT_2235285 [Mycena sp. CBHHK59/15]|nr:hypothetical protein B0H10DRAFT_2235285 [Mycena sp. CBHHK59/15]